MSIGRNCVVGLPNGLASKEKIVLMKVYASRKLNLMWEMTPIVIETDLAWAIPYWTQRRKMNPKLFWEFV